MFFSDLCLITIMHIWTVTASASAALNIITLCKHNSYLSYTSSVTGVGHDPFKQTLCCGHVVWVHLKIQHATNTQSLVMRLRELDSLVTHLEMFCSLASCCWSPKKRNSVFEELRVNRLKVIQEEICCRALRKYVMLELFFSFICFPFILQMIT